MVIDCRCIWVWGVFLFLLGCYQQKSDELEGGDAGCESRDDVAYITPEDSVIVVNLGDTREEMEPTGTITVTGGECGGGACHIQIDAMDVSLPTVTWESYTLSGAELTLYRPVSGTVDERQGIDIPDTSFTLKLVAVVDGIPITATLKPVSNIGGGYDPGAGELILSGEFVEVENSVASILPWANLRLMLTAHRNCEVLEL